MKIYIRTTAEDRKRADLEILDRRARGAGICLNSASEQMFRVSPDQLTEPQRLELLTMLCRAPQIKKHYHFCVECGTPIRCDVAACTETEGYDHCADEITRDDYWLHNHEVIMQ